MECFVDIKNRIKIYESIKENLTWIDKVTVFLCKCF